MTYIAAGIGYVALCSVFGLMILAALRQQDPVAVAAAPVAGSAALGLQCWIYGALHLPWSAASLVLPWLVFAPLVARRLVVLLRAVKATLAHAVHESWERSRVLTVAAGVLLASAAAFVLAEIAALATEPLVAWDAVAMWGYKARLFYLLSSVNLDPIASQPLRHLDYPPLWPLQIDSFWALTGGLRDAPGKVVAGTHLVAGVAVLCTVLWRRLGPAPAAAGALLLAASPLLMVQLAEPVEAGYADLPCALLLLVSSALLISEAGEARLLGVGFAALAGLTKNEGLPFLIPAVTIAIVRARRERAPWAVSSLAAAVPLLAVGAWAVFARLHGYRSDLASNFSVLTHPELVALRLSAVAGYAAHYAASAPSVSWLALALGVSLAGGALHTAQAPRLLAALAAWQMISYTSAYIVSPYDLTFHLTTSFDRLLLQLVPLTILTLGLVAGGTGVIRAEDGPMKNPAVAVR